MEHFKSDNQFSFSIKKKEYSALSMIIIINVIFFLPWIFSYLSGNHYAYNFLTYFGSLTINIDRAPDFFDGYFYQVVTAMFIHGSLMHLLFNMYALYVFGKFIENKWGALRFALFYCVVGILANCASAFFFKYTGYPVRLIGASGAVFGVLLAYGAYNPNTVLLLFFIIPIKIKWLVPVFIVIEIILEVTQTASGIAHITHLFGLLFSFLYLLLFFRINAIKKMYFSSETII
ncbi:MAG: hypothetical protein A2015_08435 [Spirochaetes bacterium GWF1_31_7]|nr:MAG: hypothetical protein A2Y30_08630 [Spirochaetes bacterium GWE1_32_154]OHD47173.1 MAG: hypothetical protein A2015_08435 [Spirochaetes bacterium GWF1_31_7]OHD47484.1 MAG: hypothetical protein A2Y29_08855 [Spirochaetes bacterium GWE2_31_10]HBD92571.1 rhomboid family intramembrane serine protease [Spirochaetia bacterium]HBI36044.1 rhomboid family intramembrane serine protease [Spirochaetia bacterium]